MESICNTPPLRNKQKVFTLMTYNPLFNYYSAGYFDSFNLYLNMVNIRDFISKKTSRRATPYLSLTYRDNLYPFPIIDEFRSHVTNFSYQHNNIRIRAIPYNLDRNHRLIITSDGSVFLESTNFPGPYPFLGNLLNINIPKEVLYALEINPCTHENIWLFSKLMPHLYPDFEKYLITSFSFKKIPDFNDIKKNCEWLLEDIYDSCSRLPSCDETYQFGFSNGEKYLECIGLPIIQ